MFPCSSSFSSRCSSTPIGCPVEAVVVQIAVLSIIHGHSIQLYPVYDSYHLASIFIFVLGVGHEILSSPLLALVFVFSPSCIGSSIALLSSTPLVVSSTLDFSGL